VKCTLFGKIASVYNNSLANYQSLCLKCAKHARHNGLDSTPLADNGIKG